MTLEEAVEPRAKFQVTRVAVELGRGQRWRGHVHRRIAVPAQLEYGETLHVRIQRLDRREHLRRRQQGPAGVDIEFIVAPRRFRKKALRSAVVITDGDQRRCGWKVVEQRLAAFEEQGQVVLGAPRCAAGADFREQGTLVVVDVEAGVPVLLETPDAPPIEGKLPRREQFDAVDAAQGALCLGIEAAQGVDLVVEEVDAQGQVRTHRVQVDERTAHGELAMLVDRRHAAITAARERLAQGVDVQLLTPAQGQAVGLDVVAGGQALEQCGHGHDQHAALRARQAVETAQTLGHDVLVRREVVVGQRFPVRQLQDVHRRIEEERQLPGKYLGLAAVFREDHQEPLTGTEFSDQQRAAGAVQRPHGGAAAGLSRPGGAGK
jgi:hypothetical protein